MRRAVFGGLGAEPPAAGGWGFGGKAPAAGGRGIWGEAPSARKFCILLQKYLHFKAILIKK